MLALSLLMVKVVPLSGGVLCCDQWRGLHCVPIMECCLLVVPDTLSPHNVARLQTINPPIRREQFPSLPVELQRYFAKFHSSAKKGLLIVD